MRLSSLYYLASLLCLLFCFACENEESLIGEEIVQENNIIISYPENNTDDDAIYSETKDHSNMLALGGETNFVGKIDDPVFGNTEASFVFQIKPESLIDGDMNNVTIQDLVLKLPYINFYAEESITADMIDVELLVSSTNNTSNLTGLYVHDIVGEIESDATSDPIPFSLATIEDEGYVEIDITSHLDGLKSRLLEEFEGDLLATVQENFLNNFEGIKIESSTNAIIKFNTSAASLNLTYSVEGDDGFKPSESIQFEINSNMQSFNSATDLAENTEIYLQSMGGCFSIIEMPFLDELSDQGYSSVHDAELIFQVSEENGDFKLPETLRLYQYLEDEDDLNIADEYLIAQSANVSNNTYSFKLTSAIHDIMNGQLDYRFRLYINSPTSQINRLVLLKDPELNLLLIKEQD